MNQELLKEFKEAYVYSLKCYDEGRLDEWNAYRQKVYKIEKQLKSDLAFTDKIKESYKKIYEDEYNKSKNERN